MRQGEGGGFSSSTPVWAPTFSLVPDHQIFQTVLKPSRHNFFDLSTLYWVRKGEGLWIFKMTALLFRTVRVMHIELLLNSYCLKDFCPGLQTPLFANSIPHLHITCNAPCLHPPIFLISPECYSRPKRNWRQCKQGVLWEMCKWRMEPSPVCEV